MSTSPVWKKALFVLGAVITFTFAGMWVSRFFIPDDAGLTAGAQVLFYGFAGLIIGLTASLFLMNRLGRKSLNISTLVLGIFSLAILAWIGYRIANPPPGSGASPTSSPPKPATEAATTPASVQESAPSPESTTAPATDPIGLGMAKPKLQSGASLRLYRDFPAEGQTTPADTLRFVHAASGLTLAQHPSWLEPAALKLDYQILYFRALQERDGYLQLEVNRSSGRTAWAPAPELTLFTWPAFFVMTHSVETTDPANNPLRQAPSIDAAPAADLPAEYLLRPLNLKDEWMEVQVMDRNYKKKGRAWLRWRSDRKLLVKYNLLS